MTFLIQHGHGKSDKIDLALAEDTADGVIFGARNEKPEKLEKYLATVRDNAPDAELLFDPQFYVSTLVPPNNRYLEEYSYYQQGLGAADFTGTRKLAKYAKETLSFQCDLGFDAVLSPTVFFDSFADRWHQTALNLADASLEFHSELDDPPPLLLSFVMSEEALGGREDIDRFLDTITQESWDMAGFYVVVSRTDDGYSQRCDISRLTNYLYLVYVLGHVNDLRVVCGYSDFIGIPLRAAGADAFACGWSQSLRRFQRKAFVKRKSGGQPPRERYTSGPLYNSIFMTELQDIADADHLDSVLSDVPLDGLITGGSGDLASGWSNAVSQRQHWQVLSAMDEELTGSVRRDLRNVLRDIRRADALYTLLESEGVQFDRHTGNDHLQQWARALVDFQREIGLS